MRKLFIGILAVAVVFGMSIGVMAGNVADVEQTGDDHWANVAQYGLGNRGFVEQGEFGSEPGAEGWAKIDQIGNNNFADITQGGGEFIPGSYSLIEQEGNNNWAMQTHDVYGDELRVADIFQDGDDNWAKQEQSHTGGGGYTKLYIEQLGDDNTALQIQSGSTGNKWGNIAQDGNDNYASMYQTGIDGEAWANVDQDGDDNTALIDQSY